MNDAHPREGVKREARVPGLAIYGLVGLTLSAAVNLLTYAGVAVQERVPLVWALHIAIFPIFGVFVVRARRWRGRAGALFEYLPAWGALLLPALFVFVVVNFMTAVSHLPPRGAPAAPPGSVAEHQVQVYTARAFSGHWVFFYALPTLFFLFAPPDERPGNPGAHSRRGGDGQAAA